MKANFSLNNANVSYLIHGQYFRLEYKITSCWFCIFLYENGESLIKRVYFKKSFGLFENVTNAYKPNLKIISFGKGIKIFKFDLKINFFNTKPTELNLNPIKSPEIAQLNLKLRLPQFQMPFFKKNKSIEFIIENKSIIINNHSDLDKEILNLKVNKL